MTIWQPCGQNFYLVAAAIVGLLIGLRAIL